MFGEGGAQESWADATDRDEALQNQEDDDIGPPPGFENLAPSALDSAATGLEQELSKARVSESSAIDDPDPRLQSAGLQESQAEARTVAAGDTMYASATTFEELPISDELKQGLYTEMNFQRPSRIQALTLPMILTPPYKNLLAQAHNGSGKTTCFVLAMLSRVDPTVKQPQALCVCPTRELVVQNLMVLERMAKFTSITATSTASGEYEFSRRDKIVDQVVIGTHGKLKSWLSKRLLPTKWFKVLVFDEADEMLKAEGFASDSVRMINLLRRDCPQLQILLFSATFNDKVRDFARKVVKEQANEVLIPKEELSLDVIKQYLVRCPSREDKTKVLKDMIFPVCDKLGQTIIFVRTRETGRSLHRALENEGHRVTSIQGDMDMSARDRVVKEFRDGTTKILIATDVLSRGFDVTQVTLVINYDVPVERDGRTPAHETYLHRIGRSGRFGRKGAAFNLVTGTTELDQMNAIAAYFKRANKEVPYNEEAKFEEVLREAGLME